MQSAPGIEQEPRGHSAAKTVRSEPNPAWWRFSLREFLLAVTAVAALIALAVKSFPSSPSPFVRQYNPEAEFRKLCMERGVKLGSSGSGSSSSMGPGVARRRWHMASHQDQVPLGELMAAYSDRVEKSLQSQGCQITGRGWSGRNKRDLSGFNFSYRSGSQQGEFVVESMDLPDGQFRWYAFCFETTRR